MAIDIIKISGLHAKTSSKEWLPRKRKTPMVIMVKLPGDIVKYYVNWNLIKQAMYISNPTPIGNRCSCSLAYIESQGHQIRQTETIPLQYNPTDTLPSDTV